MHRYRFLYLSIVVNSRDIGKEEINFNVNVWVSTIEQGSENRKIE